MPYLPSDAEKKSKHYSNIINGDILEYQNHIEDLKKQQQISSSVDANSPLRDEDGVLISFESSTPGISLEEQYEEVRLENKQYYFTTQVNNEFTYYFQPLEDSVTETDDDTTKASSSTVQFQMRNRDYLIQVMNEYHNEEMPADVSTEKLHNSLMNFFNTEGKAKKEKASAEWKEFRQEKSRKPVLFRKKGKKKYPGSGRDHIRNYRSLKKQMKEYRYDDVINRQLYFTKKGEEIWLKLGLPYVFNT